MDKERIRQAILSQLKRELEVITHAANDSREEAISEESRSENQYDMHSQEAAYLAEGQAKQAIVVAEAVQAFATLKLDADKEGRIVVGSLVTLANDSARRAVYFVGPSHGGLSVECDGIEITVITPGSPIGRQLVGARIGDPVTLPGRGGAYRVAEIA